MEDDWEDHDGYVETLIAEIHAGLHDDPALDDEDAAEVALERHLAGDDDPADADDES